MMAFFATFNTPDLMFMPRLEDVFDLYTKMVLGMAVVFQMPTVVFFLAKTGSDHGRIPLAQLPLRLSADFRRRRRDHAHRRHGHPDDFRCADGGLVSAQYRHRVDIRKG